MGKVVLKDASLVVNSVDLSDHVIEVTVDETTDTVDTTTMGATGKGKDYGLNDDKITVKFMGDFAAAKVDATLEPLRGTKFTVVVKPTSSAVSATNPKRTATCLLTDFAPIGGSVGERLEVPVTFEVDGSIAYATS